MKNQTFKAYYSEQPLKNRVRITLRDKIVNACSISTVVFYNWLNGKTEIPKLYKEKIAEITGKAETELFPEIQN